MNSTWLTTCPRPLPFTLIGSTTVPSGSSATVTWSGLTINETYEWYAVADNGGGAAVSPTWSFTTETSANQAPIITNPGTQTSTEGVVVSLQIVATDLDVPAQTLAYSAAGLPDGLTINPTSGLISGIISYHAAAHSPFSVTATVTDGITPAQQSFTWNVSQAASGLCGSDPTLVACWPMEEGSGSVVIDSTSFGNDGTTVGSPTWVTGKNGLALSLNGTDQYVTVPHNASLNLNTLTISAWIKPGKSGTQDLIKKALLMPTQSAGTDGYEVSLSSATTVFFRINQATSGDTLRINSTTSYPTTGTTWMHVAATYDGTTMRLYINGIQEASLATTATIAQNTLPLTLGTQTSNPRYYQGAIDDAQIYNRALSQSEIQALAGLTPACYALTLSHTGQGSDPVASPANSPGCAAGQYVAGASITLSGAAPASGWQISSWTGTANDASTTVNNTLTMPASAHTASVNYTLSQPSEVCTIIQPKPMTASTGEKPQSKVWNYNGTWYAVFPTDATGASSAGTWLWKLQGTSWSEVLKLSSAMNTKADVRSTGNLAHILLYNDPATQLASVEFSGGTYQLWTTRPTLTSINLPGSEIATIDIDSTGRLWLATRQDSPSPAKIVVYYSDSPYTTFQGPEKLPAVLWAVTTFQSSLPCPVTKSVCYGQTRTQSALASASIMTALIQRHGPPTNSRLRNPRSTISAPAWRMII